MNSGIKIINYSGNGYKPVHIFENWLVAVLNYGDIVEKTRFYKLEKHLLTDEIFILQEGKAYLILGGKKDEVSEIEIVPMETMKVYNIEKSTWHHIILTKDSRVIIVENSNTCEENSEYISINENIKKYVIREIENQV